MKLRSLTSFLLAAALCAAAFSPPGHLEATPATAARATPEQGGTVVSVKMAASTTIYAGTLVCANASGYAITGADTAGLVVLGIADETKTNSGSAGAESIRVRRGVFKLANSGTNAVDQDDVGDPIYLEDNQTVADTSSNAVYAGVCVRLDADGVWVDTRDPFPVVGTVAGGAVTTAKLADAVADQIMGAISVGVANTGTPDGNATITIQAKDAQGNNLAARCLVKVWFAATSYAAPADLGTLTASTGGILKEDTDDALATCQTDATGLLVLVLDTASNTAVYAHATVGGILGAGNASITGN